MSALIENIESLIVALEAKELQFSDLEDYWEELRKNGKDDEKKLVGMFNRARKIAKQQKKQNDRNTVIGIVQSFSEG
jgi:hypothetical protein